MPHGFFKIVLDPAREQAIGFLFDHAGGLETLAFYRKYKAIGAADLGLWAAPEVMARCWERLAPSMDGRLFSETPTSSLEDYFNPGLLDPDTTIKVGGLTVRMRWAIHAVPTVGLLISDGTSSLGWSGDTEFQLEHAQWLSQADLVVHECGESAKHTTCAQLTSLPEDLQKRIRLIHVPDDVELPDGHMKRLHDGEVLEIGSPVSKTI